MHSIPGITKSNFKKGERFTLDKCLKEKFLQKLKPKSSLYEIGEAAKKVSDALRNAGQEDERKDLI